MNKVTLACSFTVILLLFLILSPTAFPDKNSRKRPIISLEPVDGKTPSDIRSRKPIRLEMATFDPLRKRPNFAEGWSYSFRGSEEKRYIVQLNGPVKSEWKSGIKDTGASIISYIPD